MPCQGCLWVCWANWVKSSLFGKSTGIWWNPYVLWGDHPSHLMVQWCAHMFGDVLNGCFERWRCFGLNHGNLGYLIWLVVWNIWIIFPYIGKFIIPTGELIFFRGVAQPPTSYVQTKPNQSVEVIYFLSVDGNCKPIPQASTLQIGDQIQQPGYLSFICHQIISHLPWNLPWIFS